MKSARMSRAGYAVCLAGMLLGVRSTIAQALPPLVNRFADWADVVEQVAASDAFARGTLDNATARSGEVTLSATPREKGFPWVGSWTGPEVSSQIGFTELLATFNVSTPGKTGSVLEVRVRSGEGNNEGKWSPWLYVQSWGKTTTSTDRVARFEAVSEGAFSGKMDVDTLKLTSPANAYQLRVRLESFDYDVNIVPGVRRVSVCYSGEVKDAALRNRLRLADVQGDWARVLKVPFRAQGALDIPRPLWGEICSPTSTTMVCAYWGEERKTLENAEAIYDPTYDLFGNWGRAVSRAGELGCDAWLERFRTHEQVKAKIAAGVPVIASIKFKKGEVQGFLYEQTAGHLIVIKGFTKDGDYVVNDPARREGGDGVVYKASEMERAWFYRGGVGYVIQRLR